MNLPFRFRKGFRHELLVLLAPIVVQNLISASVSLADVIMLGRVDQVSISASSLAGQVMFLLFTVFYGLSSALTILVSQYWGKKDCATISRILGIGLLISILFSSFAAFMALFFPTALMRVWTNDPELIAAGANYLRFVAFSYLFAGLTQPYLAVMRSCERVTLSTLVSAFTLTLNVLLNAVLIFGLFGLPALGIRGAALATSISRGIELLICLIHYLRQTLLPKGFRALFSIPRVLVSDFFRYCIPAFVNDCLWGLAYSVNSMIMGRLGTDIVAANSVVSVVRELVTTVGFGISSASSIMLCREIGQKKYEQTFKAELDEWKKCDRYIRKNLPDMEYNYKALYAEYAKLQTEHASLSEQLKPFQTEVDMMKDIRWLVKDLLPELKPESGKLTPEKKEEKRSVIEELHRKQSRIRETEKKSKSKEENIEH